MWQLTIRSRNDAEGFVFGEEEELRAAMERWESDPDGNIASRKVWTVTGIGNEAHRPRLTLSILAEEIKSMSLARCS